MRDYLKKLERDGEVRVINREVDPRFELAAVTRASQARDDKVVLFNSVKGATMPVVTNIYGSRARLCNLIGAADGNFVRRWCELIADMRPGTQIPGAGKVAAPEPMQGKLSDLPLITYFEKDAGPYFTSAIYLAADPDTGVPNLSFHRSMYVSDSELRVRIGASHDLHRYYQSAEKKGKPLEAALLIGTSPEVFLGACASLRPEESELEVASLLRGAEIPMRRCRTIDLSVPADTEIVVEGRFLPGEKREEGPFGEFMGYYVPVGLNHVFEITGVYWNLNPVFHSILCGTPEDMYPLDYACAARIYRHLSAQLPGILNVSCYPYLMNTVVQIRQQYEGHARQVLLAAFGANLDYSKTCMVVDEDVNIHDLNDVWWAYLTRGRADTRALVLEDIPGFYRDPKKDHWGRLGIDATKPFHRQDEFQRKRIPGGDDIDLKDYLD